MMNKLKNTVIVWGKDGSNPLGLLRQIHNYAEMVFLLLGRNMNCATRSKYCINIHKTQSLEEGLIWLLNTFSSADNKPFIIPTGDLVAEFIDTNKEKLEPLFYITGTTEQGLLTRVLDKNYMCELAARIGLSVPTSKLFKWNSSDLKVSYPCLIKPAFKKEGVIHPFKTCICKDAKELNIAIQKLDKNGTYILQQFINKEYDVLIYGCRFENGQVVYAGSFTKYRWANNGDGSYGKIEGTIPESVDVRKLETFLGEIDYRGLFSVEFGVENGIAWFYEFNLRNDGTSHYFFQAGLLNLPLLWVKSHYPATYDMEIKEGKAIFVDEISDYDNVRSGIISKEKYRLDKSNATIYKFYAREDRRPYLYMLWRRRFSEAYRSMKQILYRLYNNSQNRENLYNGGVR